MDTYPPAPAAAYVLPFRRIARTLLAEQRRDGTCLLGLVRRHHGAQATAVARAPRARTAPTGPSARSWRARRPRTGRARRSGAASALATASRSARGVRPTPRVSR